MSIRKVEQHIDYLINLANSSPMKFKHASAIIQNGKIYSTGVNRYINNMDTTLSLHSEIQAIAGCKDLRNKSILIIRVSTNNRLKLSKPCSNCLKQIKNKNIKKIYYSTDEGTIVMEEAKNMEFTYETSMSIYKKSKIGRFKTKTEHECIHV
jgi:deoxycytidylate deaminase